MNMTSTKLVENTIKLGILVPNGETDDQGIPRFSVDADVLAEHESKFGEDDYVNFARTLLEKWHRGETKHSRNPKR